MKKMVGFTSLVLSSLPVFAATPIDLAHKNISVLQQFISAPNTKQAGGVQIEESQRNVDFNQTMHVRVKQTYQGYAVYGADAVVHIPKAGKNNHALMSLVTPASTMNGKLYQQLQPDLAAMPDAKQAEKAMSLAISNYQHQTGSHADIKKPTSELMVYINETNKAVWAYRISFYVEPQTAKSLPAKPVYIMDAKHLTVYQEWDDIKTLDDVFGGGYGGNEKMGKLVYDGLSGHLPKLKITRDALSRTCYLSNNNVTVLNKSNNNTELSFACNNADSEHEDLYWDADLDQVNHAYSPGNDALYAGAVIQDMYQNWYNVPALTHNNEPMRLVMRVHDKDAGMSENAYWDGEQMTFGDGGSRLYPLSSLGIAAHEVSHGFTEQHSALAYYSESGGLNESFSDMAAKAAEYYSVGKVTWDIGSEVFKTNDAIRYMDQPSKDCARTWLKRPGWGCSADKASDVYVWSLVNVHHSSGVFNHYFYFLSTAKGWNVKKAFDVMVQANMNYWTSTTTFKAAACGVVHATKDYSMKDASYDVATVINEFKKVAIDASDC